MSRSRTPEKETISYHVSKRSRTGTSRQYRKKIARETPLKLDETTLSKLDAEVEKKFEAAVDSEDVQTRIQLRLVQERARLESAVEDKIAEERRCQLLRKRKEQEQRLQEQVELERILEENHKQLELAKARTVEGAATEGTAAGKMQSLVSAMPANRAGHLADDVYVLGSASSAPKS